ncbi:ATP-binding protein [Shewanella sp. NIFS-20-20]|uniref:ATP-binding protein n=1 Tax=Shewanella sp. NIFS-20-20 TaxID=2853806 RepID=UPI001C482C35|nr:ATP-binding protein [Shewanella sp. NIFS-20-20]MBV7314144.1 ATP-binding protein [Shewanella sp. NIFS-20-20]
MSSLNRIILIDTHLPGVVELALDGHTNICGTNASGKTTLQRLVPVFYGEYPSRVVPSTRDSFERWYLPNEASYIIYEYRKSDQQLYQAILSSAGDGKGVNYRFVATGFNFEDYVKQRQGDHVICYPASELGRQFKRQNIAVSNLLNTREFRAIIQNDRALLSTGSNRQELRAYARQFALCDPEFSLRHIEKLAKAVHSKEGKMETVKSMVAAILEEDGVNPPSSRLNPQRVEAWIRESQLIQGFEQIRPEFDKLADEFEQLQGTELRLASLHKGYRHDEGLEVQRQDQALLDSKATNLALKQLDEQWKDSRDELNLELSAAKGDINKFEDELDAIENQYQAFMDADIDAAKTALATIPQWRQDLQALNDRHKLQTEKHQDIEAAYNARRSELGEQLNRELEKLHADVDSCREQRDAQKELARSELEQIAQAGRDLEQQGLAGFHEQEYQLKLAMAAHQLKIDSVSYTEAEKLALAVLDERISHADEEQEVCAAKLERLSAQERKLRSERDRADDGLRLASKRVNEKLAALDDIKHVLFPESHTLLEYLRREAPGWESGLGKVIAPELLHRTDLRPVRSHEDNQELFGLSLDLKSLDIPAYAASEQELRLQLQQGQDAHSAAQAVQQQAEDLLVASNAALDNLAKELTQARAHNQHSREELRRLLDEKRTLQAQVNTALAERKQQAGKQLVILQAEIKQLASDKQEWQQQHQSDVMDNRMEKTAFWQEIIGAIELTLTQQQQQISHRRQHAKSELQACETWYKNELKSRGIDEDQILDLKRQIKAIETQIVAAEQGRSQVLRYDDWYQHSWRQRKPKLQAQLTEVKASYATFEQQLKTKMQAVKNHRAELEADKRQSDNIQVEASENLTKLRSLLRKLADIKLPSNQDEAAGSISERLRQGDELLLKRESLLNSVKQYVDHFDSVIVSKSGSSLAETWERARSDATLVTDKGIRLLDYRKLVPALAQLLNVMVPQSITALREQGRIFGVDLTAYYDVLADIDRRIASQSARITREVGEELFLDGVSESAVRIRSRISELEFWPELEQFVKAFHQWQAEGFSGLPDEDYVNSMRRALDIIGRSALTGGVAKLLEIELRLKEGNSDLIIRTDRQLNESSSHGMAYLILCKFLLAFTRLLRGPAEVTVHWPIDELGTLHHNNVKKIFDACENNNISVLGAFPNPESEVLSLFANRYIINKQTRKLQVVKPKINPLAEKLKALATKEVV